MKHLRIIFFFTILCLPFFCLAQTGTIETYDINKSDLRYKYSKKQQTLPDSICCLALYDVIDKWDVFIKNNPNKIKTIPADGVFIQYVYYLAYNCKIPSSVKRLYVDKKTYPFKNRKYLNTGDVIFYGKSVASLENIALVLQNDFVVYANINGELIYKRIEELLLDYTLIPAKIQINE
jgi:hypothetical protein